MGFLRGIFLQGGSQRQQFHHQLAPLHTSFDRGISFLVAKELHQIGLGTVPVFESEFPGGRDDFLRLFRHMQLSGIFEGGTRHALNRHRLVHHTHPGRVTLPRARLFERPVIR